VDQSPAAIENQSKKLKAKSKKEDVKKQMKAM
jgi:hypothetical protein